MFHYFHFQTGGSSNARKFPGRWVYLTKSHGYQLVSEPPVTKGRDVASFLEDPLVLHYPCHTQSVERNVALTSRSVTQITGQKRQRNAALVTADHRRSYPGRVKKRTMSVWIWTQIVLILCVLSPRIVGLELDVGSVIVILIGVVYNVLNLIVK